jgi:hypothetical protein
MEEIRTAICILKRGAAIWLLNVIFIAALILAALTIVSFVQVALVCPGVDPMKEITCIIKDSNVVN